MKKIILTGLIALIISMQPKAQEATNKLFTITSFGITVTGTYSEGFFKSKKVDGTNILWGLISWGGSSEIECLPGNAVCKIERILSVTFNRTINRNGEAGFEPVFTGDGSTPVFIGEKDGAFTFAVDMSQTAETQKPMYMGNVFELKAPFVLGPVAVRRLNLISSDTEEKGYVIPAGKYPLYRDGNIYYWTFTPPRK